VLLDSTAAPAHAVVHLVRAWRGLADVADGDEVAPEELLELALKRLDGAPPAAERRRATALLDELLSVEGSGALSRAPTRSELLRHARWLRSLVAGPRSARRRRRAIEAAIIALVLLVPAGWYLGSAALGQSELPWLGRYYHNGGFRGDAWAVLDRDVRFDWEQGAPFEGFRHDGFAVRWDTCLLLEEETTTTFQLTSDDGSRLVIDGQPAIDELEREGLSTSGHQVKLSAGVHHLRVEYREIGGSARVALTASLHGEPPTAIAAELLRPPPMPLDEQAPCRGVEP
jgi:hypothetical protein